MVFLVGVQDLHVWLCTTQIYTENGVLIITQMHTSIWNVGKSVIKRQYWKKASGYLQKGWLLRRCGGCQISSCTEFRECTPSAFAALYC